MDDRKCFIPPIFTCTGAHTYVHANTYTNTRVCRPPLHPLCTIDPRYIPCIGYVM